MMFLPMHVSAFHDGSRAEENVALPVGTQFLDSDECHVPSKGGMQEILQGVSHG